jgi:hypothetical protein
VSDLYWLRPGWTDACCARCGAKIWPDGDPDWGFCVGCFDCKLSEDAAYEAVGRAYEDEYYAEMARNHALEFWL